MGNSDVRRLSLNELKPAKRTEAPQTDSQHNETIILRVLYYSGSNLLKVIFNEPLSEGFRVEIQYQNKHYVMNPNIIDSSIYTTQALNMPNYPITKIVRISIYNAKERILSDFHWIDEVDELMSTPSIRNVTNAIGKMGKTGLDDAEQEQILRDLLKLRT
jgi:hypothetical protein